MISLICFITDVRSGEVDILGAHYLGDLVISDLDGKELKRVKAETPWTHEKLESLAEELGSYPDGADAHINGEMVGSTEI
jgi:5'-deoxynucleotidase